MLPLQVDPLTFRSIAMADLHISEFVRDQKTTLHPSAACVCV
jgi:hypothetical protein